MPNVDLKESDITSFSYRKGEALYLEEDCDAPKFIDAFKAKYGHAPSIVNNHRGGFIRGLARIHLLSFRKGDQH